MDDLGSSRALRGFFLMRIDDNTGKQELFSLLMNFSQMRLPCASCKARVKQRAPKNDQPVVPVRKTFPGPKRDGDTRQDFPEATVPARKEPQDYSLTVSSHSIMMEP